MVACWTLKGIETIGHQRCCRHNRNQLVEQGQAIFFEYLPVIAGLFLQQHNLVSAFIQCQEQGEQDRHQVEPGRDLYRNNYRARQNTQDKAAGNDKDIEQHDMFEANTIKHHQQ